MSASPDKCASGILSGKSDDVQAYDVVVLGGGPAGTAAALALMHNGFSVAVLERTHYEEAPRIGETLPPAIVRPLTQLGVWEAFLAAGHRAAPGIVSIWGGDQLQENDFIFNPYGHGWHLDRVRFDAMLADAAEASGGVVYRSTRVEACNRDPQGLWHIRVRSNGVILVLTAIWAIDATGRTAWLARRQGTARRVFDRLVALVGFGTSTLDADPRTVLEACSDGWWYAATLPGGCAVGGFFTDADFVPRDPTEQELFWDERLRRTRLAAALVKRSDTPRAVRVVAASSAKLARAAGIGWLAVGDAAQSHDPLSGQGITKALESGLAAAAAVAAHRAGDLLALEHFASAADVKFQRYQWRQTDYYARETRWSGSVFWQRRSRAR